MSIAYEPNLVELLINYGANPNHMYEFNIMTTSLYEAIKNRNLELIKILLENGANPLIEDEYGWTAEELSEYDNLSDYDDDNSKCSNTEIINIIKEYVYKNDYQHIEYRNSRYEPYKCVNSLTMLAYKANKFIGLPDCIVKEDIREKLKYEYMLKLVRQRKRIFEAYERNMCEIAVYFSDQNMWDSEEFDDDFHEFIDEETDGNPWNIEAGKFMLLCIKLNYIRPFRMMYHFHSFLWIFYSWFIAEACIKKNRLKFIKFIVNQSDPDNNVLDNMIRLSFKKENKQVCSYLIKYKTLKNH